MALIIKLRGSARLYLLEVWGYNRIEDVDYLTWRNIEENAADGFILDRVLVRARRILRSKEK